MRKQPLTPAGLQELLSSLYQLPEPALQLEAAALAADLRDWIEKKFIVTTGQQSYLSAIDDRQIANTAANGQYFLSKRLPIEFIKQEKPANYASESEGKFFGLKKTSLSTYMPLTGYSEEETLTITIAYS